MALNAKQRIFIKEYLKDKNATKAAQRAGYSKKTAGKIGSENLSKPEIKKEIEKGLQRVADKAELKASDVLAEIRKLAFMNVSKAYDDKGNLKHPMDLPEDLQCSLQSLEVYDEFAGKGKDREKIGETKKVKFNDKVRALEMLAKHFKLLTDVSEVSGKDGAPLVVLTMPSNGSENKPK